jgi:hypothetical protein
MSSLSNFVLTMCADKYADKSQSQHSVVVFQRENTVLGNMANSELTFVLWLHATVSIRDGILGTFHTEEVQYFYNKALKTMKAAVAKASEDGEYPDNLLNAMACIMATAVCMSSLFSARTGKVDIECKLTTEQNFSGMFKTAEIHRDALVRTLALRGDGDVMAGLKSTSHFTTKASQWSVNGLSFVRLSHDAYGVQVRDVGGCTKRRNSKDTLLSSEISSTSEQCARRSGDAHDRHLGQPTDVV